MGRHREDEGPLARRLPSGRLQALLPVLLLLLVARAHDHGVITNRPDLSTSKASLQDSRVRSAHRMCPLLQALDQCRHTTLPTQVFWPTALANNPVSAFCTSGRIPGSGICWILASTPAGERIRRQGAQSQAPEQIRADAWGADHLVDGLEEKRLLRCSRHRSFHLALGEIQRLETNLRRKDSFSLGPRADSV